MPLDALPSELISRVCEELGDTSPPFRVAKLRQIAKTLASLRLTSRRISEVATRQLFREFCLVFEVSSWKKLLRLARNPNLAKCLYHIRLEVNELSDPLSTDEKFDGLTADDICIKLSWFPNLKSIDCERWHVIITDHARAPTCQTFIQYPYRKPSGGYLWYCLSTLTDQLVLRKFSFQILRMSSDEAAIFGTNILRGIDLSRLAILELYFNSFPTERCRAIYLELLLPNLHDLPNLDTFSLAQFCSGPCHWQTDLSPNLIGGLKGKCWPRLRHLEFRHLVTTVADFVAFILPHAGALDSFFWDGELTCNSILETAQEQIDRTYLEGWIRAEISPTGSANFGTRVRHHELEHGPDLPDGEEEL